MKNKYAFLILLLFPFALCSAEDIIVTAPDGETVTIRRDAFGVPHIESQSEVGVLFGQGFAVAQDRLYQMELNRRAAEGKLSSWFGPLSMAADRETRTLFYTEEERQAQFDNLSDNLQALFSAYSDGVNTYIDSMAANPAKFQPGEFNTITMERWSVIKTIAVIQYLTRIFGQAGGEELDRLLELQENGEAWFDANRPINDPDAPVTIAGGDNAVPQTWSYSGMRVEADVIRKLQEKERTLASISARIGIPPKFGSFAVLISQAKSATDDVMLLGAPQMGEPQQNQPNITHEIELISPTLHVGGMTVAGIPLVIIGHTEHHAWTMTSGTSDNSDIYIETTENASFGKYMHQGQSLAFQEFHTTIDSLQTPVPFTFYRTIHGPVIGSDLANNQAYALKMTFWNKELEMAESVYRMIKATNLEAFEEAARSFPFSFNLHYAGKDQKIKYWHVGLYQDRSDGVDPRLPHKGDGSEEWGGLIPFGQLPQADGTQQDYFVNWNNKPVAWWNNGDNISWGASEDWNSIASQTQRVTAMQDFVAPISSFSFAHLKDVPRQITSHGTYQQVVAFTDAGILDENIIPPGQSAFKDINYQPSPHRTDQWDLHRNWQFKDMEFADAVTHVETDGAVPERFNLDQNYPNPFNPTTTISYALSKPGQVTLEVYNVRGQLLATLFEGLKPAGQHEYKWNAGELSSGIYLYKLTTPGYTAIKKSLLLK